MKDWPQHNIPTKKINEVKHNLESSDEMIEKIIQHHGGDPMLLRVDLEILRHLAKREQMIEDHKVYMGAIKEE